MNIGLFTDTYFPQLSGVATSILTLKTALEEQGHNVFIFTTTDPHLEKGKVEPNIFRFSSMPFVSFTDRRIAYRGLFEAVKLAKKVDLDIVHTQTEFALGLIGKYVAHQLNIPAIHTYHTMYEDYLHYVLNGRLLKPYQVQQVTRTYLKNMAGVIAPSKRVEDLLTRYEVGIPMRVIPTGVDIAAMNVETGQDIRQKLGISPETKVILTLSRVAQEKKIDQIIKFMPELLKKDANTVFVVAGDGPDMDQLTALVKELGLEQKIIFTGAVDHGDVGDYYRMADLFVSASDTETQGLTYIEALAAGTRCIVYKTDYTDNVFDNEDLGACFANYDEMHSLMMTYLEKSRKDIDDTILQNKLEELSAAHFASEVARFYEDVISQKNKEE